MPSARGITSETILGAATDLYLRGEQIDMSSLATSLGIGRATLYRRVGNHESLLGQVLADQTEQTFRSALRHVANESDAAADDEISFDAAIERSIAIMERFIHTVLASEPLKRFAERDPVLFARVIMAPGSVEDRATDLIRNALDEALGTHTPAWSTDLLARTIVRVADSTMYAHLLTGSPSATDDVISVVRVLLSSAKPS